MILAASRIFEFIFGGTDTFNDLSAVEGIRSLTLGLGYSLFILGLTKLLTSTPSEAGGKLLLFIIAGISLTAFPKLAIAVYEVSGRVQLLSLTWCISRCS